MTLRRTLAFTALSAAALLAVPASPGVAQEAPAEAKEPKTVAVTKGRFAVELTLNGVLDAVESWEVMLDADHWSGELEVVEAVPTGPVEKGQTLVRFKTDKIDEAVAAAERDLNLARWAHQKQVDDARRAEEALAVSTNQAKLRHDAAVFAWKRFQEVDKAMRIQEADLRLQTVRDNYANNEEELRQLEQMYNADELVEETEDIVLRRTRRRLARQKISLGIREKRDELWRTVDFPRQEEAAELTKRKADLDWETFRAATANALDQGRTELEKARVALARQEENFTKLTSDREKFELKAPEGGLAVWGALNHGKWSSGETPAAAQIAQGRVKVKPNNVLYTIVQPGAVRARTSVKEANVLSVAAGMAATVRPGPLPRSAITAKVASVASIATGGSYAVVLDLTAPDERLLPGHSCKVKLTLLEKPDALTVPAAAVEADGDNHYVHVWLDGKATRTEVSAGETSKGRTEIVSGVTEGDRVLATAPKAK
jgi:HlyD family secretion protein